MEHVAAILLIVGCSHDLSVCRELPAPVALYEAVDECEAERPFSVGSLIDSAERVIGTCVAVDPALEEEDAQIVWDVKTDGRLDAQVGIADVMVASNGVRPEKDYLSQE